MDWGLYYYNARYYVPGLGRFASADTIVPDPGDPQSFNRYSYGLNNPAKYRDPSGHAVDPGGAAGGRACDDWHGCPELRLTPIPFEPTYEDDPRRHKLIPIVCLGSQCQVQPEVMTVYLAGEMTPGVERDQSAQELGAALDAAGAAIDLGATGVSGSFTSIQIGAALFGGPGLDDAAVMVAYGMADEYVEDPLSRIGAVLVAGGDLASGESDLNSNRLILGQDTSVLVLTTVLGEFAGNIPVADPALDTVVNLAVNTYDIGRLSGRIPNAFEFRWSSDAGIHVILYP